ncbi:hypothetical protein ATI53_104726, partial [Salipiger aestuarii]
PAPRAVRAISPFADPGAELANPAMDRRGIDRPVRAGLIEKRTMANGARSGFSDCGVFFGVAIARVDEFLSLRAEIEADRKAHARLRGLHNAHKRHLKGVLCELIDREGLTSESERIHQTFAE